MWAWFELYGWNRVRAICRTVPCLHASVRERVAARAGALVATIRSSIVRPRLTSTACSRASKATVAKCVEETTKGGTTRKFYLEFDDGEGEWARVTPSMQPYRRARRLVVFFTMPAGRRRPLDGRLSDVTSGSPTRVEFLDPSMTFVSKKNDDPPPEGMEPVQKKAKKGKRK